MPIRPAHLRLHRPRARGCRCIRRRPGVPRQPMTRRRGVSSRLPRARPRPHSSAPVPNRRGLPPPTWSRRARPPLPRRWGHRQPRCRAGGPWPPRAERRRSGTRRRQGSRSTSQPLRAVFRVRTPGPAAPTPVRPPGSTAGAGRSRRSSSCSILPGMRQGGPEPPRLNRLQDSEHDCATPLSARHSRAGRWSANCPRTPPPGCAPWPRSPGAAARAEGRSPCPACRNTVP